MLTEAYFYAEELSKLIRVLKATLLQSICGVHHIHQSLRKNNPDYRHAFASTVVNKTRWFTMVTNGNMHTCDRKKCRLMH